MSLPHASAPGARLDAATLALALLAGVTLFVASAWATWLLGWRLHGEIGRAHV